MTGHAVRWLFHSTAMVADYDLAVERLGFLTGLGVLEYGESTEPGIGRRGGMAWVGDNAIEIGQPVVDGAARQFVARHGGGMHSVALQVEDLDATMAHLEAEGRAHRGPAPARDVLHRPPRHRRASSSSGAASSSTSTRTSVPRCRRRRPSPRSPCSSTPSWGRWSRSHAGWPTGWPS